MTQCVSINQLAVIQPGKERNERRREVEREKKNCVMVVRAKTIAKNSSKISDAIFGYTKSARWGSCCCRCCCCLSRRDFQFQLSTVLPHAPLPRLLFLPSVTHLKIWNTPKVKFEFWPFSKLKKNFPFLFLSACVWVAFWIQIRFEIRTPLGDCLLLLWNCAKCAFNVCLIAEKAFKSRILSAHAVQLCGLYSR